MSAARSHTDAGDRIVVCGSFLTVAAAASLLDERNI
jgi:folylpolyglutamate synthase/dihydropteroate synthase